MARAAHQSAQRYLLTSILGTDTGLRIVRELARHGGQLSAPDIGRRTGLAKASVARGLEVLEEARVVEPAGTGRSVVHRLRPDHPLAPALIALFEAEEARFEAILDSARSAALAAGPGVLALWLFGSVARGDDRADSDVDLAFVAEPEALSRLADVIRDALVVPAERLGFSPSVVALATDDVVRLAAEHDPWWRTVTRDAVPLVGANPDDLAASLKAMASAGVTA
jgi:predicted nucleotidyltransferase